MKMRNVEDDVEKLEELMEVLATDTTEFDQLSEIRLIWQQVQDITRHQQELVKRDIKKFLVKKEDGACTGQVPLRVVKGKTTVSNTEIVLANLVEEEQIEVKSATKGEKYLEKEASVKAEMSQAKQQKSKVEHQCDSVKGEMEKCQREQTQLSEKRKTVERDTTEVLPKYRYDVNLYNRIFRIRWQYDSEPDEICGYVCNKTDVKPFSLNRKQHSQFFTTSYLWDLIEEDTPEW